jgi:hypothetical protein
MAHERAVVVFLRQLALRFAEIFHCQMHILFCKVDI